MSSRNDHNFAQHCDFSNHLEATASLYAFLVLCNWTLIGNCWEQAIKHDIFILELLQIKET